MSEIICKECGHDIAKHDDEIGCMQNVPGGITYGYCACENVPAVVINNILNDQEAEISRLRALVVTWRESLKCYAAPNNWIDGAWAGPYFGPEEAIEALKQER